MIHKEWSVDACRTNQDEIRGKWDARLLLRAQRDSNPRPAAPQAAILSKLNYGPPATDNFSIYELPFATQQRLRATPLHKV